MEEFRNILVIHKGKDWGRAIQRLLEMDDDIFPYDYVHQLGTEVFVRLPNEWDFKEIVSENGDLLWNRDDIFYTLESAKEMVNPTNYCTLFRAHLISR